MLEEEENPKRINLIIRKPQNGKTGVAISIVSNNTTSTHIIFTMNTIMSGLQFTTRVKNRVKPDEIITFNSKNNEIKNCNHAKNLLTVFNLLQTKKIKAIICCSHKQRFKDFEILLRMCADSLKLKDTVFEVHIDEAHKYMRTFSEYIRRFNECKNVNKIFGYTATPDNIFDKKCLDPLFSNIYIFNYEKELDIISSPEYFGVKDAIPCILDDVDFSNNVSIPEEIPKYVFERASSKSNNMLWYKTNSVFNMGNEFLYLQYIDYVLNKMTNIISQDSFSYHFMPGYKRQVTHYQTGECILNHFPNANVIIMNMKGIELYRLNKHTNRGQLCSRADGKQPEPSDRIYSLITEYRNFPTFITGFDCCGMSVTLINEDLGNFNTVTYDHEHLKEDDKYQLCRYLFNYQHWSIPSKSKIKKTIIYSRTKGGYDYTLDYENYIDNICCNFLGKTVTIQQLHGKEEYKQSEKEVKKELKNNSKNILSKNIQNKILWRKYHIYDKEEEDEQWEIVRKFYEKIKKKKLKGVSMPKKIEHFYHCSTTKENKIHKKEEITICETQGWYSMFQLTNDLNYIRIFVGYENLEDPNQYTIFVKYVQLEDKPEVHEALNYLIT